MHATEKLTYKEKPLRPRNKGDRLSSKTGS